MNARVQVSGLSVDQRLFDLVESEMIPGTGVESARVWSELAAIVSDLGPTNRQLLEARNALQERIDAWHVQCRSVPFESAVYEDFLKDIGYLLPEGPDFKINTQDVDPEIANIHGPQLVVPLDNARYAINAANARWGSLYDALYGTDVIDESEGAERTAAYNPIRGSRVVSFVHAFLDVHVGLRDAKYSDVAQFSIADSPSGMQLMATLKNDKAVVLQAPEKFVGFRRTSERLESLLFRDNGLHIELLIDRDHPIGRLHSAGIKDVVLESAITTIQDCEDSVAAVDAADKVGVYRNWLGLMNGQLEANFEKNGRKMTRRLEPDRTYTGSNGEALVLPGRSLLLVRNVGIHMYTDAVTTQAGAEVPEGFLDALLTALASLHDLRNLGKHRNSRTGSIYIVKPKLHGPAEVAATIALFSRVEDALGLPPKTLKIGIMDEERRTTVNLKECIRQAKDRLMFINTGFLDRTGDEIHTSMEAGPVIPKLEIKDAAWMLAYEDRNVDIGIEVGLPGTAQIGKGMWAMPERMAAMLNAKVAHPRSGASTAWVPSPTAATLHAIHYHQVNVAARQTELRGRLRANLRSILSPPLLGSRELTNDQIQRELDNNAQGILGYVVRWIDQGIGCSKVLDINNVGLMEDRATLRISSQHISNWLYHGIITEQQIRSSFERMAAIVDEQNADDRGYVQMAARFDDNLAFQAALDLVLSGRHEPNGYTERILSTRRRAAKSANFRDR